MSTEIKVSDAAAKVLEALVRHVLMGTIAINRQGLAEELGLTPSQMSRCLKELETKEVVYYGEQGHLFLSTEVLSL